MDGIDGCTGLNIGAHKEAAEHFLSALELQESTGDRQTSDQLWFTLRRAFLQMVSQLIAAFCFFITSFSKERNDLAELARPENHSKLSVFRQHGFDF